MDPDGVKGHKPRTQKTFKNIIDINKNNVFKQDLVTKTIICVTFGERPKSIEFGLPRHAFMTLSIFATGPERNEQFCVKPDRGTNESFKKALDVPHF